MGKHVILRMVLILCIACISFSSQAFGGKPAIGIVAVNHVVSAVFHRDCDYYTPTGRILFTVSKSEFPTISILDELYIVPSFSAKKIIIYMYGAASDQLSRFERPVPANISSLEYLHLVSQWNLYNKKPGMYLIMVMADDQLVTTYGLQITQ